MKNLTFAVLLAACVAVSLVAQEVSDPSALTVENMSNISLLNVREYSSQFLNGNGSAMSSKYLRAAPSEDRAVLRSIGGDLELIDIPLEIALLSTCAGVVDIRPARAVEMLPANDPKLADLKLGAATYMDMQMARFTGGDAAPYAAALKFITDRGNVSEADIKGFMRDGIRSALTAEMSKDRRGFVPIETYNDWKQRGYGDFIGTATDVLMAFFESPTQRNYEAVRGMVARQAYLMGQGDVLATNGGLGSLINAIKYINLDFGNKIDREIASPSQSAIFAKAPNDQRLNVFSIPYAVGEGR